MSQERSWKQRLVVPLGLFALSFALLAGLSWERVTGPSTDPHFVYQARAWLEGSLELTRKPPHGNDWASYEWIKLRSGQELRGVWLDHKARRFRSLEGEVFIIDRKEEDPRARKKQYFMSFPPMPAVVMTPLAAIWGYRANDVLVTLLFAALNVALMFVLLRRLSERGLTERSLSDNLWLTLLFGAGTAHLWCAVLGQVWFTALIMGVSFTLMYMLASIDARRPLLAGLFLAAAFATRTPLVFSAVFFAAFVFFPGGRWLRREDWGQAARKVALFALPCLVVGLLLLYHNHLRFSSWTEFGHSYLAGGQIARIQKYGLFNYHFLSKNLSAALTLLPRLQPDYPYVMVSRHGMSLLLSTPALVYLFRPLERRDLQEQFWWRALWVTVAAVATPALFYQNTGYEQFSYRFSLDYTPYLIVLLAAGRRPLSRWFKLLVLWGIGVNLFGAITFKRFVQFYLPGATFFDPDA